MKIQQAGDFHMISVGLCMYERKIMSHDKQRTDMFGEKSRMPYKETKTFDRSRAQTLSLLQNFPFIYVQSQIQIVHQNWDHKECC